MVRYRRTRNRWQCRRVRMDTKSEIARLERKRERLSGEIARLEGRLERLKGERDELLARPRPLEEPEEDRLRAVEADIQGVREGLEFLATLDGVGDSATETDPRPRTESGLQRRVRRRDRRTPGRVPREGAGLGSGWRTVRCGRYDTSKPLPPTASGAAGNPRRPPSRRTRPRPRRTSGWGVRPCGQGYPSSPASGCRSTPVPYYR